MPFEFKVRRQIGFAETDMAGIVHFSNFFRYMEDCEHAFYRSLGASVIMGGLNPPLGFPRVHAECDYKKPIRFEDILEVQLYVREKRSKVLTYVFKFRKINAAGAAEEIARGLLTVVCVAHFPDGTMASAPIPSSLANQIEIAPPATVA